MKNPRVVAVIPAYNEEGSIGEVVKDAQKYVVGVMVVDNDSTDNTLAEAERVTDLVYSRKARGVGAATRMGWINVKWDEFADVMVTLDADGQHNPNEIPSVIAPIVGGEADLVIGSRFMCEHKIPRYRKFGINVITWLYNVGSKQKLTDAQSGFRAYSKSVLDSIDIAENGFGFSTEVLVKARKLGFRITEVPISCIYHEDYKQNSTLNPIRHGLSVSWVTIKWRLKLRN